jgi:hypothetical protein
MTWTRIIDIVDKYDQIVVSHGSCSTAPGGEGWVAFFIVEYFILLIVAARWVSKLRRISEEYQDARFMSLALDALLQMVVLVVAASVVVFEKSVVGRFIVMTTFIFLSTGVVLLFGVASKFRIVLFGSGLTAAPKRRSKRALNNNNPTNPMMADSNNTSQNTVASERLVEIDTAVRIATVRDKFMAFVQDWEGGLDLFHFVLDVQAWKDVFQNERPARKRETAAGIVQLYVADDAIMQVDVQAALTEPLIKAMDAIPPGESPKAELFDDVLKEVLKILQLGAWAAFVAEGGMYAVNQEKTKRGGGAGTSQHHTSGGGRSAQHLSNTDLSTSNDSGGGGVGAGGGLLSRISKKIAKATAGATAGIRVNTSRGGENGNNSSNGGGGGASASSPPTSQHGTDAAADASSPLPTRPNAASVKSVKFVQESPVAAYMDEQPSSPTTNHNPATWKEIYDAESDTNTYLNVMTGEKLSEHEYERMLKSGGG